MTREGGVRVLTLWVCPLSVCLCFIYDCQGFGINLWHFYDTDKPSHPEDLQVKLVEAESVTIVWKPPADGKATFSTYMNCAYSK